MKRETTNIINLKRGDVNVSKVYRGNSLVWQPTVTYIYVFRNNNTNTVRKYDLDGNLVNTLSNSSVNFGAVTRFAAKLDDGSIYGFAKNTSSTGSMAKLNPDLTFSTQSSINRTQDVQIGPNCLFTASNNRLQSRTFDTMTVINQSSTFGSGGTAVIKVDEYSNAIFYYDNDDNVFRSFDKNNTTITQNFNRSALIGTRIAIWTHPNESNAVYVSNSSDTRTFTKDNSAGPVTLSNCDINTRDVVVLSNGNVVYGLGNNLICRTIANITSDLTTNVFSIAQGATVLSLQKDDSDNIYVLTASTIRKYTSSGSLVWEITGESNLTAVVANNY